MLSQLQPHSPAQRTPNPYPDPVTSVFSLMLDPSRRRPDPAPLPVDLFQMLLVGIALWCVALVATWLRWRTGAVPTESLWTCVAGIVGGVVALLWARFVHAPVGT